MFDARAFRRTLATKSESELGRLERSLELRRSSIHSARVDELRLLTTQLNVVRLALSDKMSARIESAVALSGLL